MIDDVSRYNYFCQFRSTIRISRQHLIVGIDIAKDKHHAFFGTAYGKTLWKRLLFSNDKKGYMRLIEQVNALKSQHQLDQVVFGMEPTGNYHKPLANWLIENGYEVVLVGGKAVKDNRQLLDGRWDKNDTKDSANITDLMGQAKCQFYGYPEEDLVALRNLISLRKRLKKEEHRLRMQIRNSLLAKYFPEADCYLKNCAEEDLGVIRWYLDPRKIATTDFKEFVKHVTTTDRGIRQLKRLRKIYDAAENSVGLPVNSAVVFEAQIIVDKIRSTRKELLMLMNEMKALCNNLYGYTILLTIPGFGPYISALVLATIGNPFRFKSRKQVIRLAGLDLNANRSGKTSNDSIPVISKKGNADLRYGLYQAGLIATTHNEGFRRLLQNMLEGRQKERGIRTKMRVKMAAKLLVIAWTMLKNNEAFDPRYLTTD